MWRNIILFKDVNNKNKEVFTEPIATLDLNILKDEFFR